MTGINPIGSEFRVGGWRRFGEDLKALSARDAARFVANKVSKRLHQRTAETLVLRKIAALEEATQPPSGSRSMFAKGRFEEIPGLPVNPDQVRQVVGIMKKRFPNWCDRCLAIANRICEGRVYIIGHEVTVGDVPAWHRDYFSGAIWPAVRSSNLKALRMNRGADIKFVWELSRFHHGVTLARAFAISGNEKFARKFLAWFSDWRATNPPCVGPNWTCAMEVAIRAVNLLWAASLLEGSRDFDESARREMASSLLEHGIFIRSNLEYDEQVVGNSLQRVNGNHYLSDLAGLIYIASAFPENRHSAEWGRFAIREFFEEIRSQIDEDGVHWEYSPGYHRLVLEMVLGCVIVLERTDVSIPEDIKCRVMMMLEFIRHYRKPSGGVPLVRDNDSGRFCILGEEELTNHDHLLSLGAIVFNRADLYPGTLFEDCLWQLGSRAAEWEKKTSATAQPRSRLYRQSGFAFMREGSSYMLALCCPKGTRGYCGHTHNDFLSFELEAFGRTFITDCGSYVYTQSPKWRNRFRSTASHNTLLIDGREQNPFNETDLFEIGCEVQPRIEHWRTDEECDFLVAAYTLDLRAGERVIHERRFVFLKKLNVWLVQDRVSGGLGRKHTIEARFHFAPGIELAGCGEGCFRTTCASGPNLVIRAYGNPGGEIDGSWVARSYAVKEPARLLRFPYSTMLPFDQTYLFAPTENEATEAGCRTSVLSWDKLRETLQATELLT